MWNRDIRYWTMVALALASGIFLMSPRVTFAGIGGSDVPTVTSPVTVGQTAMGWSFTITNTSTTPNDVDNIQVLNASNIFFTTTCGTSAFSGQPCPDALKESANTIAITSIREVPIFGSQVTLVIVSQSEHKQERR